MDMEVDHIDGDKTNNNPANLRLASREGNRQNVGRYKNNSTGKRGVWFNKSKGFFYCSVQANGERLEMGPFTSPEDASVVYEREAKSRFGEFYRKGVDK